MTYLSAIIPMIASSSGSAIALLPDTGACRHNGFRTPELVFIVIAVNEMLV